MKKILAILGLAVGLTFTSQADVYVYTVSANTGLVFTNAGYLRSISVAYPNNTCVTNSATVKFYDSWTNGVIYPYGAYSNITYSVTVGSTNAYTNYFGATNYYVVPNGSLIKTTTNVVAAGTAQFKLVGSTMVMSNYPYVPLQTLLSYSGKGLFISHGLYQTNYAFGSGLSFIIDFSPGK